MRLALAQRRMVKHLLCGSADITPHIRGNAARRLAIYRHGYRTRLVAALRDTYEKTSGWLGEQRFDDAALAFIEARPPSSWTLSAYGKGFDELLIARYPADPEVAELAWLDWSLRRAFDGPDAAGLTEDEFRNADWDTAVLRFVPTLRVRSIHTNCAAIWTALSHSVMPPAAALLPEPRGLRVWRQDLTPRFKSTDMPEVRALSVALSGANFASVCAVMSEGKTAEGAATVIGAQLAAWFRDELLTSLR